jgi:ABC-type nitrate/sulfonate/bicarbonate transport system permease component
MAHLATARETSARGTVDAVVVARPSARRLPDWWTAAALAVALLAFWEVTVRVVPSYQLYYPAPSTVARTLVELTASGELGRAFTASLQRLLPGLAIGALVGLLLGLAMGWSEPLRRAIDPFIAAAHPIPKIAVLPLVMVIFGVGETSKIIVIALGAFFPMVINTMAGVRQIHPIHFEVARSYGAGRLQLLTRVVLPASLPMVLTGLRLALNFALLIAIAVEIVSAHEGLGATIWLAWEVMRTEVLYASLFVVALLGIGFNGLVVLLSRLLVPWALKRTV